jgi:hypothetical protein
MLVSTFGEYTYSHCSLRVEFSIVLPSNVLCHLLLLFLPLPLPLSLLVLVVLLPLPCFTIHSDQGSINWAWELEELAAFLANGDGLHAATTFQSLLGEAPTS